MPHGCYGPAIRSSARIRPVAVVALATWLAGAATARAQSAGPAEQGPKAPPFPMAAGATAGIGVAFVDDNPLVDGGTALGLMFSPYLRLWPYLSVGLGGGGVYTDYSSGTLEPLDPETGTYGSRMSLKIVRLFGTVRGHLPLGRIEPFLELAAGISLGTMRVPIATDLDPDAAFTEQSSLDTAFCAHAMAGFEVRITREFRLGAAYLRTYNRPMDFGELSGEPIDVDVHAGLVTIDLWFDLPR